MKWLFKILVLLFVISPFSVAVASGLGVCQKVFTVSASALANKEKGVTKEKLLGALPLLEKAPNSEPLRSMHEIVEEVYNFDIQDKFVYSVYRTELCVRRVSGKPVPNDFSKVYPVLESCSGKVQNVKTNCAMHAAGSY